MSRLVAELGFGVAGGSFIASGPRRGRGQQSAYEGGGSRAGGERWPLGDGGEEREGLA